MDPTISWVLLQDRCWQHPPGDTGRILGSHPKKWPPFTPAVAGSRLAPTDLVWSPFMRDEFGYPVEIDGITYETVPSIIRKWNQRTVSLREVFDVFLRWGWVPPRGT